jgi:hypothetical protein
LDFVWVVVMNQQQYAAAASFYSEIFTAHPHSLTGPQCSHRYRPACAAARAGCGPGRDAADLEEESRAGFRRQALDWLRAELVSWLRLLEKEPQNAWKATAVLKATPERLIGRLALLCCPRPGEAITGHAILCDWRRNPLREGRGVYVHLLLRG